MDVLRKDGRADSSRGCAQFGHAVLKFVEENSDIETVVLVGRWAENFERYRFAHGAPLVLRDLVASEPEDTNSTVLQRALVRTVERLNMLEKKVLC